MIANLKLFNTLTRRIEKFVPIESNVVKIYVCGPTVYDFIHIGNARPMVIFDCLRRYLTYLGFEVTYVQNFTDVDDKIIRRAVNENVDFELIVKRYLAEYEIDAKGLGVQKPSFAPRVSENIDSIIDFIEKLVLSGHAYESGGDVFFRTESFESYGQLSKMNLKSLESGKRIKVSALKENEFDFVLWKSAKPGEPFWRSPWGNGRPGWHIECSVMASKFAAKTLDIHCGGRDLIFPHHENEIAQSESVNGVKFSNFWLHNGYITVNSEKMSKSKGNFLTVRELANEFGYDVLRFMLIQAHYRAPINFSNNLMEQCESALSRIKNFKNSLNFAIEKAQNGSENETVKKQLDVLKLKFLDALNNDFNTADAVSVIFDLIRNMSNFVNLKVEVSKQSLIAISDLFDEFSHILQIVVDEQNVNVPKNVLHLFEQRKKAREAKNFALADDLRENIERLGFIVIETRKGSRLIRAKKNL